MNHLQNIYFIAKILFANAGIVQRLECGLAKAKMPVRFRLLAPFENNLRAMIVCKFLFYIK